jgi:hypothetical protein
MTATSFIAWLVSTVAGGGDSLLLIPAITLYSLVSTGFSRDTKSRFWRLASNLSSWSMMSGHISFAG